MQCAFVDVGIQRDFSFLSDINLGEPWQVDDEDDGEESQPPVSITDIESSRKYRPNNQRANRI